MANKKILHGCEPFQVKVWSSKKGIVGMKSFDKILSHRRNVIG